MSNINKYFVLLESLKLPEGADLNKKFREQEFHADILEKNVERLRNSIKLSPQDLLRNLLTGIELNHLLEISDVVNFDDPAILYSIYSIYMLLDITKHVNFHSDALEDLVSENHKTLIVTAIRDVSYYSLQQHLHESFYVGKNALFHRIQNANAKLDNFAFLEILVDGFTRLLFIRPLHIGKSLGGTILDYMSGIFSLLLAHDTKLYILKDQQYGNMMSHLQKIWLTLPKRLYMYNLMLMKSCGALPELCQRTIHKQLLLRLWSHGGFMALVFALTETNAFEDEKNVADVVAKIVAEPNYTQKAKQSLISQIIKFADTCLKSKDMEQYLNIAFNALYQLCETSKENQIYIKQWLHQQLRILIEPSQIEKSNIEIMEFNEFSSLISLLHHMFCRSTMGLFSMDFLTPYLCLLLKCHNDLKEHDDIVTTAHHYISAMILKCLNDYEVKELDTVICCLSKENYPKDWYQLQEDIVFKPSSIMLQEMLILIDENECKAMLWHPLSTLSAILKKSKYYLLTYQIFKILFRSLPTIVEDQKFTKSLSRDSSLLQTEEDIYNTVINDLSNEIFANFQHIQALETLIQLPQIQSLIQQNIMDIVTLLRDLLVTFANLHLNKQNIEKQYTVITIALSLIKEIIENVDMEIENIRKQLLKPLKDLQKNVGDCDSNLLYQISNLLQILGDDNYHTNKKANTKGMAFKEAKSLIKSKESYEQVEGFDKLIKLIKIRDQYTVSNGYTMLALGLNKLKSTESYTFLNCVRLFKSIISILESEALEMLRLEYLTDSNAMDYRLVVGEAILQVGKELGPLIYKYRTMFLNCFLHGCLSDLDEFRCSSFSNLSQLCRILTYQVHHYFQELMNLIEYELTIRKYLPAKRASVLLLNDLLEGMNDLMDYDYMLLPIYRLLKNLLSSKECDEILRLHAANALECLSTKCKSLLSDLFNPPLQKDFVISSHPKNRLNRYILHMN